MDYGLGQTNIDHAAGIRYGVISQNSILQAWADNSEGVFPCETCDCDGEDADYCAAEALHFEYTGDGYEMVTCLDTDVMVLKAPFYTFAPFCSPCVPGAGNLDDAARAYERDPDTGDVHGWEDNATYCVGHDWFDDGVAPYPVFGALSNMPCFPDNWYGHGLDTSNAHRYPQWYGHAFLAMPAGAVKTDYCASPDCVHAAPYGWTVAG